MCCNTTKQTADSVSRLVSSREDSPDVNDDVDGVGQQFQGELCLQQGVNLLHMVRDVLTDVLKSHTHTQYYKTDKVSLH